MNSKHEKDEHLETLWTLQESDLDSMSDLQKKMGKAFKEEVIEALQADRLVEITENGAKIKLTSAGKEIARAIIRAHRLAERLIYDVLGGSFESGACEFEHMMATELVDSVCTLLGHPKECPHGLPIPRGECCSQAAETMRSSVASLTKLKVGQVARVAYINCENDQRLHKIDGFQIRPGVTVRVHQTYPTYVIECEGANIALDERIAASICVWKPPSQDKF